MEVSEIPTNRPIKRIDDDDEVYRTEREKNAAICAQIADCYSRGQPILVGTVSIEKSELALQLLNAYEWEHDGKPQTGIPHSVLNARYHEQEAYIVADAGVPGAVTIATNMAGRGTDIQLGGNLEMRMERWRDEQRGLGVEITDAMVRAPREAEVKAEIAAGREAGAGHRRPVRARHRAPREPAHRQPAARPHRPPGRPRPLQVLPLHRGRPAAHLRRRAAGRDHAHLRRGGRRGDHPQVAELGHRHRPEEGRAAQLRDPQEPPEVRRRRQRPAQGRVREAPGVHGGRPTSPRWSRSSARTRSAT